MTRAGSRSPLTRAGPVALAGGVLFVLSLGWGAYVYLRVFGRTPPPWSDAGWRAVALDTALFTAFALHHSIFARAPIRVWVSAHIPRHLERSLYVIVASVLFAATMAWWVPVPGVAWHAAGWAGAALHAVQAAGVLLTAHAARQLGVLTLAGIAQAGSPEPAAPPPSERSPQSERPMLRNTGVYGWVRHPIYFAWLLMVWPTPFMTGSRLLFAALSTIYLTIAIPFEERTLDRDFGPAYADYRRRVRWRMLPFLY